MRRGGGRVRFVTGFTSRTARASPFVSPGGSSCSSSGSSASASPSFFFPASRDFGARCPPPTSSTFQPSRSTMVPALWKRSTTGEPPFAASEVTAVMTVVTNQTKSSCHAASSRRQTSS